MAMSVGVFSSIVAGETASLNVLASSSSSSSLRPLPSYANFRARPLVIRAAASKPATETKKREPRGITKPRRVSPEMQAFLGGVSEISRTQVLKAIWAYIKQNNLQDPQKRKDIVCDEKLKTIFSGKERVGFLEIAGLISPHFLK